MGTAQLFLLLFFIIAVVIFQPEIRRWLKQLGRVKVFSIPILDREDPDELAKILTQIILAVKELAKSKSGALIVMEPPETEHDYVSPGTQINADISCDLILSIFVPKSPLHDGAIIIQKNKIKAAGVILPITDNRKLSSIYGTRHRAALSLSEAFDCLCIVVSEETGSMSLAYHSKLIPLSKAEELTEYLSQFYSQLQIVPEESLPQAADA